MYYLVLIGFVYYTLIVISYGIKFFSIRYFMGCFSPNNYFINFYCVLVIIQPLLNLFFKLEKKHQKYLLIIFFILFSIVPTINNSIFPLINLYNPTINFTSRNSDYGYTLVHFIFMYLIGGYIRKNNVQIRKSISVFVYIYISIFITFFSYIFSGVCAYDNSLVIISSICLFCFFNQLNIKQNKILSMLSSASLGIFVLHTQGLIIKLFNSIFRIYETIDKSFLLCLKTFLLYTISEFLFCLLIVIISKSIFYKLIRKISSIKILNKEIYKVEFIINNNNDSSQGKNI